MKKLTALLCVAAMTFGMSVPALANPSLEVVSIEPEVKTSEQTAEIVPEGKELKVIKPITEDYKDPNVAKLVEDLYAEDTVIDVPEAMDVMGYKEEDEIKTVQGNPIDPWEYTFVTRPKDLVLTDLIDETKIEYNFDGTVKEVEVTVTVEALKGVTDVENYVIMLCDPMYDGSEEEDSTEVESEESVASTEAESEEPGTKKSKVCFIEITKDDLDPETGELTIKFPFLGTFTLLQKLNPELSTEAMTEAVTE